MKKFMRTVLALFMISSFTLLPDYTKTDNLSVIVKAASVKTTAPAGLKANVKGSAVTLTWNKVSGAEGYRVYIYDSSDKKYKKYRDVSSTKCVINDLKGGKTYYFKVAALKDGIAGEKSKNIKAAVQVSVKVWAEAYLQFLKLQSEYGVGRFSLCDVTGDSIPEIILAHSFGHTSYVSVYTYKNSKVMEIPVYDEVNMNAPYEFGEWSHIYYSPSLGIFANMDGYGGTNDTVLFRIQNGKIVPFAHFYDDDTSSHNPEYPISYQINGYEYSKEGFMEKADKYNADDYIALGTTYVIDRNSSYWTNYEDFDDPNKYVSADELFDKIIKDGRFTQTEKSTGSVFYIYRK